LSKVANKPLVFNGCLKRQILELFGAPSDKDKSINFLNVKSLAISFYKASSFRLH